MLFLKQQNWRLILIQLADGRGKRTWPIRLAILALAWVIYLLVFFLLHPLMGDGIAIASVLPVMAAGWLYGPWQGIVGAMAAAALSVLLIFLTGTAVDTLDFIARSSIGTLFLMSLGGFLGVESNLRYKLQAELSRRENTTRELEQSEARYRSLFENSVDGIFLMSERFVDCNEQACKMFACQREDVIGHMPDEFSPEYQPNGERSSEAANQRIQAALNGNPQVFAWEHLRKDGIPLEAEMSLKAIQFPKQTLIMAVMRDMTKSREIERSEQDQRKLAEALIEVAAILTNELDPDEVLDKILASVNRVVPHDGANITLLNRDMVIERVARASMNTGRAYTYSSSPDTFTGTPIQELANLTQMVSTGRPLAIPDTANFPGWKVFPESAWVRSNVGAPITVQGRTVGFISLDSATPGFYQPVHGQRLGAFANLAAIAIHNAHLYARAQQQAVTDELTGLYNRRGLMSLGQNEVERSLRFGHPISVLMFDVDNFKQINDRYDYRTGDRVLYLLAKRCRQRLRSVDIAGRYGGDEFVIVLPETPMEAAIQAAERLRFSVASEVFTTKAGTFGISISVGVAILAPPQDSFEQVLEQAGAALHKAKLAGKNRVTG